MCPYFLREQFFCKNGHLGGYTIFKSNIDNPQLTPSVKDHIVERALLMTIMRHEGYLIMANEDWRYNKYFSLIILMHTLHKLV